MGLGGKHGRTSDIQVPLRNVAINPNGEPDLRLSAGAGSVVRFCRALRALGVLPPRLLESAWQARSALRWAEDIHDGPNRMVSSFNSLSGVNYFFLLPFVCTTLGRAARRKAA